jgi:hypothetical protein
VCGRVEEGNCVVGCYIYTLLTYNSKLKVQVRWNKVKSARKRNWPELNRDATYARSTVWCFPRCSHKLRFKPLRHRFNSGSEGEQVSRKINTGRGVSGAGRLHALQELA